MNEAPIHYTKLPGTGLGWSGWTRLWLAEDHLLEMNWTIVTERYHRVFLQDIRSVLAQRTKTGFYWNVALGSLAALGLAIAGALYWGGTKIEDDDGRMAVWIFGGMFAALALVLLVLLGINALFGPTCRFYVQTAAGTRLLAAPTRLRGADRLLAKLVPHIESVQSVPQP